MLWHISTQLLLLSYMYTPLVAIIHDYTIIYSLYAIAVVAYIAFVNVACVSIARLQAT